MWDVWFTCEMSQYAEFMQNDGDIGVERREFGGVFLRQFSAAQQIGEHVPVTVPNHIVKIKKWNTNKIN